MREAGVMPEDSGTFDGPLPFPDQATAPRAVLTDAVAATLPQVTQADGSVLFRNRFCWVGGSAE